MRQNTFLFIIAIISVAICGTNASIFMCKANSDCLDGATCKDYKCECPTGKIYNSLGNKCLELLLGYGQECEDWEQCALLAGQYTCKENKCVCDEGWLYLKGKCIEYKQIGEQCTVDEECFDGMNFFARKCDGGQCKCSDDFYTRDEGCRKKRNEGEVCAIDTDCQFVDSVCNNGKCEHKNVALFTMRTDLDEEEVGDEIIQKSLNPCGSDSECQVEKSYCHPLIRSCVCKEGYFIMGDKCVPELGTQCNNKEECEGLGVDCINNVCACEDRYMVKLGNMRCLKEPVASEFYCAFDESCRLFGSNFFCNNEKKCECQTGYALMGSALCKPTVMGGEVCTSDEECNLKLKNSICYPSGSCICADKFEYNINTAECDALLGGSCKLPEDCKIENSVCKTNCTCADSFVQVGDKQCIPVVSELYQKCNSNIQCAATFTGSYCKEGICQCESGYLELDGICLKTATRINESCSNKLMCDGLGEDVVCRNGICQCGPSSKPSRNGKYCEGKNSGAS